MAKSILRAGKIAGIVLVAITVVAVVLYSAGVLSFAQGDPEPAPIAGSGASVETADARAAALLKETVQKHMRAARYDEVEGLCNDAIARAPGTDEALRARQSLAELYILTHNDEGADAAVDDMVAVFADHGRIVGAVCEVGDAWRRMRKFANAERLYSYVTEHFADNAYSMWSQKNLCTLYVQLGDESGRDAALDQLLDNYGDHPDLPLAICSVGDEVARIRKDYEKARELYAYAAGNLSDNEQAVWAQKNLCKLLVERIKDTAAAQVETDRLFSDFADNPNLPAAALETADAWRGKKHISQAQAIYERIVTDHPKSVQALWSQKNICAIYVAELDESAADSAVADMVAAFAESDQLPKALCETADAWRTSGRADKAAVLYEHVTGVYPSNWHAIWSQKNLCTLYAEFGDTQAADAALDNLITTYAENDQLPKAICEAADAYRNANNPARARQLYNQIIDTYPAHTWALWSAKNLITMDIDLLDDPNNPVPQIPTEVLQAADDLMLDYAAHPDITKALLFIGEEYYKRAFRKDPGGRSAEALVEFEKALVIFGKSIAKAPVHARYTGEAHYLTASALHRMGRYAEAIAHLQIMLDKWPEHRLAWSSLYNIGDYAHSSLKRRGDIPSEEAARLIEKSFKDFVEKYPDLFMAKTALRHLGSLYLFQERNVDAINCYEELLSKDPDCLKYIYTYYCIALENIGRPDTADEIRRVIAEAE